MKKSIFCLVLLFAVVILSCSKDEQEGMDEVIQWSELLKPSVTGYVDYQKVASDHYEKGLLPLPISSDSGHSLYQERAQLYLLQGKSGRPDLLEATLEQVYSYVAAGLALPVNDLYEEKGLDKVIPANLAEALTIDGKLYGFPNYFNVRLLVYRKDIFEKHNLKVPTTWDELIDVSKIIHEKEGINGFMFATQAKDIRSFQEFMSFYFTLADNIYSVEDGVATYIAKKEHLEQVLELYQTLFDESIDPNNKGQSYNYIDYALTGGQVGMMTVGPWVYGHVVTEPTRARYATNLAVAPIPIPYNGAPGTYMEVKGLVFNPYASEEKRDATAAVAEMFVSEEFSEMTVKNGGIPARVTIESDIPFLRSFSEPENIATGKVLEYINWEVPQISIVEAIQNVIYHKMTPAEAADDLERKLKAYAPNAVPKSN